MSDIGRPTVYTPELAKLICQELAEGRSLRSICRGEHMPARSTVYDWLDEDGHDFLDQYTRARARQAETMLDEIIEIADETAHDTELRTRGSGEDAEEYEVPNVEYMMRSRLRVDARKWAMSKLAPKKYGDSKQVDVTSKGQRITGFQITDVAGDDSDA